MALRAGKHPGRGPWDPSQGPTPSQARAESDTALGGGFEAAPWSPPGRIGRYVLGEALGEGGMGKVYAAFDLVLKREVALKLLWRSEPAIVARFIQEAQFQARLDHPNICKVFEVEAGGGTPYIAMQLVHGRGLLDTPLDLELNPLLDLMIQCAEAVHAAHEAGMIHRDLKPGNILLEPTGAGAWKPVLLDFGLAKDLVEPGLTVGSKVMGTPAYMAPEQALGAEVTVRSDVYSLGATLYAFLAGHAPFRADSAAELMLQHHRSGPAPLRRSNPGVPPGLARILHTCMARRPEHRYPSALALADDLRRLRAGGAVHAQDRRWSRLHWRTLVAGAALAVLGAGTWLACRPPTPPLRGVHGTLEQPVRVLLVSGPAPAAEDAWMAAGLSWVPFDALSGRRDILCQIPAGADASTSPRDPAALAALGRQYGADLVILTTLEGAGEQRRVAMATLAPLDGRLRRVLDRTFQPAQYLEVEEHLRRTLPGRLGVSDHGDPWAPPRLVETRKLLLQAQLLLTGARDAQAEREALPLLLKATAAEPDYATPHAVLARIYYELAFEASYAGHERELRDWLAKARGAAERTIQLAPTSPSGYTRLGPILNLSGDLDGAERSALQALKLEPQSAAPHWLLASVEFNRPGPEAFQRAVDHARAGVRMQPRDPAGHYRLAQIHLDAGQFPQAQKAAAQAVALQPDQLYGHMILINAYLWNGQVAQGETALQAALAQHPKARLLLRNAAFAAYLARDWAALGERLQACRGLWPQGHSTRQFLDGLEEAAQGRWGQVQARYAAQLKNFTDRRRTLPRTERTTFSVDLYLMGRVLAQGPAPARARAYVELAEAFYPKRVRMAQRDPAFKGLWPRHESWPGDTWP